MCRSRRELSNEYLLAKFRFDTAENEPCKVCPLSAYIIITDPPGRHLDRERSAAPRDGESLRGDAPDPRVGGFSHEAHELRARTPDVGSPRDLLAT